MERARGKPGIDLATIRDAREEQAKDLAALHKRMQRRADAHAALPVTGYTPEHLAKERARIDEEFTRETAPTLRRMEERVAGLRHANGSWSPAARRLGAALADPSLAAALAQRLAHVRIENLAGLGRDAVASRDFLLADAIAVRLGTLAGESTEHAEAARVVLADLDRLGTDDANQVAGWFQATGADLVRARVLCAEGAGTPISPAERFAMAREFPGPGMTAPELQEVS